MFNVNHDVWWQNIERKKKHLKRNSKLHKDHWEEIGRDRKRSTWIRQRTKIRNMRQVIKNLKWKWTVHIRSCFWWQSLRTYGWLLCCVQWKVIPSIKYSQYVYDMVDWRMLNVPKISEMVNHIGLVSIILLLFELQGFMLLCSLHI